MTNRIGLFAIIGVAAGTDGDGIGGVMAAQADAIMAARTAQTRYAGYPVGRGHVGIVIVPGFVTQRKWRVER